MTRTPLGKNTSRESRSASSLDPKPTTAGTRVERYRARPSGSSASFAQDQSKGSSPGARWNAASEPIHFAHRELCGARVRAPVVFCVTSCEREHRPHVDRMRRGRGIRQDCGAPVVLQTDAGAVLIAVLSRATGVVGGACRRRHGRDGLGAEYRDADDGPRKAHRNDHQTPHRSLCALGARDSRAEHARRSIRGLVRGGVPEPVAVAHKLLDLFQLVGETLLHVPREVGRRACSGWAGVEQRAA